MKGKLLHTVQETEISKRAACYIITLMGAGYIYIHIHKQTERQRQKYKLLFYNESIPEGTSLSPLSTMASVYS